MSFAGLPRRRLSPFDHDQVARRQHRSGALKWAVPIHPNVVELLPTLARDLQPVS